MPVLVQGGSCCEFAVDLARPVLVGLGGRLRRYASPSVGRGAVFLVRVFGRVVVASGGQRRLGARILRYLLGGGAGLFGWQERAFVLLLLAELFRVQEGLSGPGGVPPVRRLPFRFRGCCVRWCVCDGVPAGAVYYGWRLAFSLWVV